MLEFISNIEHCYHRIAKKPLSKISSSVVYLSFLYIESFKEIEKRPFIIGIPCKENLDLILSAALLKNFFNEDYLLHSDKHFKKLQLKNGDRVKIFGMHTFWNSSNNNKNGFINLRQTQIGAYGERTSIKIKRDIRNEWLPYIEKANVATSSIIKFKTFYRRLKENRVERNALDQFLDYKENGFGIPSQALCSKIILVTGRGRKAKTIGRLKNSFLFGESFYNLFIKNNGLELVPDLKNYVDDLNPEINDKIEKFITYGIKIVKEVKNYDNKNLIRLLQDSDIQSKEFINELEEFETYIDDNELAVVKTHLNELKRIYPKKKMEISNNIKCIIVNDSNISSDYFNTIQAFVRKGVPVLILTSLESDPLEPSVLNKLYRFYFSRKKIKFLMEKSDNDLYDVSLFQKNEIFINQRQSINIFKDHGFEDLILRLSKYFYDIKEFENLKRTYWKIAYPVFYLFKNSPQSNFSEYRVLLQGFFDYYKEVIGQLPKEICESIELLKGNDWKNEKKITKEGYGFDQNILLNDKTYSLNFKKALKRTKRLRSCNDNVSFTGIPYRDYYQGNIIRALFKYFIPEVTYYLFPNEYKTIKRRLEEYLTQQIFNDYIPFVEGIDKDFLVTDKQIEEFIFNYFPSDTVENNDNEIDIVHENFHQKFIENNRRSFASDTDCDHSVACKIVAFSNDEWMYVPYHSTIYMASEEEEDIITISKMPTSQFSRNDIMILYNMDVSELTKLASNNLPLQESLKKLKLWRRIVRNYLKDNSIKIFRQKLLRAITNDEQRANPSIQNIRNWCNDEDLISPIKDNLSLILRFGGELEKLEEIYVARKAVIAFRNTIRKEIRNKLKTKIPKVLTNQDANSDFAIPIFGIDVLIKTRQVSYIDKNKIQVPYHHTKRLKNDQ